MQDQDRSHASQPESSTAQALAGCVAPFQLVSAVKPGPSGTVASTAALATASHGGIVTATPELAPAGLLSASSKASSSRAVSTIMQDLLRAAEKALASGLGDWHLQAIQDISPEFDQHVLMGALGPETLKHKHKLSEPQILHIYGLLHRHCSGFQEEVQAAAAGAEHREQLLAHIWTAFRQLWDECVQVSFQGEVLAAIDELQSTYTSLLDTQEVLAAVQQENAALTERCSEFVRANLDHMLAWRSLKAKADALEGEVTMLSSANSEISLRAAAISARNTQLTVQLEGLGARLSGAEQQIQDRGAALAAARTAMLEKDSGLRQLEAQVAVLGQQLVSAQQDHKQQDSNISNLEQQLQHKEQLVLDAERRVADKQRAFNLLHADFAKQKADATDAAQAVVDLQQRLSDLQAQLAAAKQEAATAQGWHQRWEAVRMEVEDLAAANKRAMMRRHELVASYWPVMARLNQAEDAVAALTQQVVALGREPAVHLPPRDTRAQEVGGLGDLDAHKACSSGGGAQQAAASTAISSSGPSTATEDQQQQQQAAESSGQGNAGTQPTTAALQGVHEALQEELEQLRSSYLLLQEEHWRQKERLMGLDLDMAKLKAVADDATAKAAQATDALVDAQQQATKEATARARLEADLAGCRSWIRELERTEQQYLKTIRQQGALEQAAVTAQRQANDLRSKLAEVQTKWQLAQAAADVVAQEHKELLQRLSHDLNRASLVEQALQQVFKQEVSSGRARCSQLQEALHQRDTDLAAAKAQLTAAQQGQNAAEAEQQSLTLQLQGAQQSNTFLQQQVDKAQSLLQSTLQRLEGLESRISLVNSSRISSSDAASVPDCCVLDAAIESALHMLDRVLAFMQCLAADAATISNASNAAKVEVLVAGFMQGLEEAAVGGAGQGAGQAASSSALVLLRNAAGEASKQRCQGLERQLSVLQLQLGETSSQLVAAASVNARLQRALNLKSSAVSGLEQQLAAVESQLRQLQASHASADSSMLQLHAEVAAARLREAKLQAQSSARAVELQAAQDRAAAADAAVQQLQGAAAVAEASTLQLTLELQQALAASRQDALVAAAASSKQAADALQIEQLQRQVEASTARVAELEREMKECRHKADICSQAARVADYRAVETTTLLADVRRELEFSQKLLEQQQQV